MFHWHCWSPLLIGYSIIALSSDQYIIERVLVIPLLRVSAIKIDIATYIAMLGLREGVGWGGSPNEPAASQPIPLRASCKNSKVWAFRSALEFRRSQIKAELGEFVEGD